MCDRLVAINNEEWIIDNEKLIAVPIIQCQLSTDFRCRKLSRIKDLSGLRLSEPMHTDRQRRSGIYDSVRKYENVPDFCRKYRQTRIISRKIAVRKGI
jgi:hypothetical protein